MTNKALVSALEQILRQSPQYGQRMDSASTFAVAKELEAIEADVLRTEYAPIRAAEILPFNTNYPAGATHITYRQVEDFGESKIVHHAANDLTQVNVGRTEVTQKIVEFGNEYSYSLSELEAAALMGTSLTDERLRASKDSIDRKHDKLAALGDDESDAFKGFVNHGDVELVSAVNGSWEASATTLAQILEDIAAMTGKILKDTLDNHRPDSMALPPSIYAALADKRSSGTDKSVLDLLRESHEFIDNIHAWHFLEDANAGGNGPRVVCYKKDPQVAEYRSVMAFKQEAPQARNLALVVPARGKSGGVALKRPMAVKYMDV